MRNNNGSILIIVLGFMTIFTLLGTASIHLAGVNNTSADKRRMSMEALWLADGGVEIAKNRMKQAGQMIAGNAAPVNLNPGDGYHYYDVYSVPDPDCPWCSSRWMIHACGSVSHQDLPDPSTWCAVNHAGPTPLVGYQFRAIEAIMAKYNITDVLSTEGPIKDYNPTSPTSCLAGSGTVGVSGSNCTGTNCNCYELVEENTIISFEEIFNGLSYTTVVNAATPVYNDVQKDNDIKNKPISGVTVMRLASNLAGNNLSISTDNVVGTPFLIIDTRQVSGTPTITFNGSIAYSGIVWIEGNASLKGNGNATINGAVFVNGNAGTQSTVSGNIKLYYDATSIAGAVSKLNNPLVTTPAIIAWKEI